MVNKDGSVNVVVKVVVQAFASVTVTEYVPAAKPALSSEVIPEPQL